MGFVTLCCLTLTALPALIMLCTCAGADVNGEAKDGATPLYEACRNDHSDIVDFLLSQSADANRAGKDGLLPLHVAARRGNDRYNANTNTNAAIVGLVLKL